MFDREEKFIVLTDEVERQGGARLPGTCQPTRITYVKGVDHVRISQAPLNTTGCRRERRFQIPDIAFAHEELPDKAPVTIACATDDRMDLWPRFQHAFYGEAE